MNQHWTVTVEAVPDSDDVMITLPEEILADKGWKEGDTIRWIDNKDGSWTLERDQDTELVLVECVSMFRTRYLVEVPKGRSEWALDTVVCNDAKEFSQHHIGEEIVSHRVVDEQTALSICDSDNDYTREWTTEMKKQNFFTAWTKK
jgi:hypothetical protein